MSRSRLYLWLALICSLIMAAMLFCLPSFGQTPEATMLMSYSRPLGNWFCGADFSSFNTPTLPGDAVIQGIYPTIVLNRTIAQATTGATAFRLQYGSSASANGVSGSDFNGVTPPGGTFGTMTAYSNVPSTGAGTSLSILAGNNISAVLYSTLFINGMHDSVNIYQAGFAVYYKSATPTVTGEIYAPFTIPHGYGLAWAMPTVVTTTTGQGNCATTSNPMVVYPRGFTHLSGLIKLPDGTNFNGTMTLKLNKAGVKNICNYPYLTVPTEQMSYQVQNAVPVNLSNATYTTNNCMSPSVPYYMQLIDTNGIVQGSDNWYLPDNPTQSIDIGDMQEEKFTGPISVAIPQAIVSTPSNSQSITQPSGTSLDIYGTVNFHGTVNYATTPAFSVINATQVLVNGVGSSTFQVDANGQINASGGFCVASCSTATVGQALVYNGTAFVPGTPSIPQSNLYYQTMQQGGTATPQRAALNFDNTEFVLTDSTTATKVGLLNQITAGTYTGTTSITVNKYGQVTALGSASSPVGVTVSNTGSGRALTTIYQNTTGYNEYVTVVGVTSSGVGHTATIQGKIGNSSPSIIADTSSITNSSGMTSVHFMVPQGWYYEVITGSIGPGDNTSASLSSWTEYTF